MPEALQPDSMAAFQADVHRRLQILEATSRVGLNRVRFAWSTHAGSPVVAVTNTWEQGPVAATWADDRGNTGTGYPRLTLTTGRKALFFAQGVAIDIATEVGWRVKEFHIGIGKDGQDPRTVNSWGGALPFMRTYSVHGPITEGSGFTTLTVGRSDIPVGEHTFGMWGFWGIGDATGATWPYLRENFLAIIPID